MLTGYLHGKITGFEKEWGYDATHLHELLNASPGAFLKYVLMRPALTHCDGVPRRALWAAHIEAVRIADCGHCLKLAIAMADRDGFGRKQSWAMMSGNLAHLSDDARLGQDFARAVLAKDAESAIHLRAAIVDKWDAPALASLSLRIALASFYPTLKRAMGSPMQESGICMIPAAVA